MPKHQPGWYVDYGRRWDSTNSTDTDTNTTDNNNHNQQ